ncbi:MAG: peptidylprolyl isomerase [Tenacibaculum sp.]
MAILSKIRERSLFLIIVVGLALFAFVLDPSTIGDFFNASKVNEIGKVNGQSISRREFSEALETYKQQTSGRVSEMQAAKNVWNNLLRQKIYQTQLENAGITVGETDILNALIESSGVQNQQRFQTNGLFDKDKFTEFLALIKAENTGEWKAWQNYMKSVKNNLEKSTYDNLVASGLGASLKEGEAKHLADNTKIFGNYIYVPYASINDSLVNTSKSEVKSYIKNHSEKYQVEASRDIKFVKFEVKPTDQDQQSIKMEVAGLIEDFELDGTPFKGFKNISDYSNFFQENNADFAIEPKFIYKSEVPQIIADSVFKAKQGSVFGPYKDQNYFKLSKITQIAQLPDSVQARHILIPFTGARSADPNITKSEEDAKKMADSLLAVVKQNPSKFADLAKELSSDKGSATKGGFYDWFTYNRMVAEFRDFVFEGKKNDVGVVKTIFGFHVIRIENQKNFQKVVKLASFGKAIEASEATENRAFQNAEMFAQNLAQGKDYNQIVKDNNLKSLLAVGLKSLDENVPNLGKERELVSWVFDKKVKVNDFKRFDVESGFVVAVLTNKTEKGLMPVEKAITPVRPILINDKKAQIIKGKMNGISLDEISKSSGEIIRTASSISLQSPTLSGVGYEPKIVGAMLTAKKDKVYNHLQGDKGVYAFVVKKRELPTALPNYDTYRKRIANQRKNKSFQIFEALKKASKIENKLSSFYGIQQ